MVREITMSTWKYRQGFDLVDDTVGIYCGECDLEIHDNGRFVIDSETHSIGSYQLTIDEMKTLRDFMGRAIEVKENEK